MLSKSRIVIAAFAMAVAWNMSAHAAEYWVDQRKDSASDDNPGTKNAPWKTIAHAAASLQPGDTVNVAPGVYRETIKPKNSGTAEQPIVYRATGPGVAISGADQIDRWAPTTAEQLPEVDKTVLPKIWCADLDWKPQALFQDGSPLTAARIPNQGWWVAEGGTTNTLIDTAHLSQPNGYWEGASVFFWDVDTTTQHRREVTAFDGDAHRLVFAEPIYRDRTVEAGVDRYFLENHPSLIDQPGEWAVVEAGRRCRVFLWPLAGVSPDDRMIEGARRSRFLFDYGDRDHLRVEGFEIRHGAGHGIGSWTRQAEDIVIADCWIHHNLGNGIYIRFVDGFMVRGNCVEYNNSGVTAGTAANLTVERNEIAKNDFDGLVVSGGSRDVTIRRNLIRGHNRWGHPDNIQFFRGLENVRLIENVLIDAGQSLMMEECRGGEIRGNVIVGAEAYSLIFGHGNVHEFDVTHNTIAFSGYGNMSFTGTHYRVFDNILYPGGHGTVFSVANAEGFESDCNLFFKPPEAGGTFVAYARNWPRTFAEYRKISNQDAHTVVADPQFRNAPVSSIQIDNKKLTLCSTSKFFVRGSTDIFDVGDHVEVKFDGVVRTVEEVGRDWIVVSPPLEQLPEKAGLILNWKEGGNYALDLRVGPDSPARNAGRDGASIGADLDLQAFLRGDVDGDGAVDIRRPE